MMRAAAAPQSGPRPGQPLAHEPRVALAVIEALLAAHSRSGRITVLLGHAPGWALVDGDRVRRGDRPRGRHGAEA